MGGEDPKPASLWQALADPTRRQILDLLRTQPLTTGQLAGHFPSSRFAVMKHLNVLESTGLRVVRRAGRERWNHLNAIPLQLLYDRWVKPYQALWASKLTNLKSRMEEPMTATTEQVELEIAINSPIKKVWKALVDETTFWWPKDFYTNPKTKGFHIDPRLGGKVFEDYGKKSGAIRYEVFAINPPHSLDLQGCMAVPYGPAHTMLHLELETKGDQTILKLSGYTIGNTKGGAKAEGWKQVFEDGLKKYVEAKTQKLRYNRPR